MQEERERNRRRQKESFSKFANAQRRSQAAAGLMTTAQAGPSGLKRRQKRQEKKKRRESRVNAGLVAPGPSELINGRKLAIAAEKRKTEGEQAVEGLVPPTNSDSPP